MLPAILSGFVVIALLIAARVARGRLARLAHPVGRLIDVEGRRVHVIEAGRGPVVVLVGGTWAWAASWSSVIHELAGSAHVLAWDRPGLGWSDPNDAPRTPSVMADELKATLQSIGIEGPVVLVGHSFGGVVARAFASRYQADVAGLVLLDPAHEAQFERFPAPIARMADRMGRLMPRVLALAAAAVSLGLVAVRPRLVESFLPGAGALPGPDRTALRARLATEPSVLRAMAREMRDLLTGYAEMRGRELGAASLGSIPLRIVSHGRPEGVPPGLGPDVAAAYEAAWQALQLEQASFSTRGRRTVAEGIGHDIPGEAPSLVVAAVTELLAEVAAAPTGLTRKTAA